MSYVIDRLGHLGDGLTEDGLRAYRTLPGEIVDAEPVGKTLERIKIVEPSDNRIKAECRHYSSCGGCAVQHATPSFIADWKLENVKRALEAQGIDFPVQLGFVAEPSTRRRAKLTGTRTKSGAIVGFHARAAETLVDVPDCRLLTPAMLSVLPFLREITKLGASRKSTIELHMTEVSNGLDLTVKHAKTLSPSEQSMVGCQAAEYRLLRLHWNDDLVFQDSAPLVAIDDCAVPMPPEAFLQASESAQRYMISYVLRHACEVTAVMDLFSGLGTFSLPLSKLADVVAVEGDAALLSALNAGWRAGAGLRPLKTLQRDLFRSPMVGDDFYGIDLVVIDPPRAGAELQSVELAKSNVRRVVSISCNPQSFARDARILLDGGFICRDIEMIDQFKWSPHIELVAYFDR